MLQPRNFNFAESRNLLKGTTGVVLTTDGKSGLLAVRLPDLRAARLTQAQVGGVVRGLAGPMASTYAAIVGDGLEIGHVRDQNGDQFELLPPSMIGLGRTRLGQSLAVDPDGSKVAIIYDVSQGLDAHGRLAVVDLKSGSQRVLADSVYDHGVAWSPDGLLVLAIIPKTATAAQSGNFDPQAAIFDLRAKRVVPLGAGDESPTFSPDGRSAAVGVNNSSIYITSIAHQEVHVVDGTYLYGLVALLPQGKIICWDGTNAQATAPTMGTERIIWPGGANYVLDQSLMLIDPDRGGKVSLATVFDPDPSWHVASYGP